MLMSCIKGYVLFVADYGQWDSLFFCINRLMIVSKPAILYSGSITTLAADGQRMTVPTQKPNTLFAKKCICC